MKIVIKLFCRKQTPEAMTGSTFPAPNEGVMGTIVDAYKKSYGLDLIVKVNDLGKKIVESNMDGYVIVEY